MVRVERFRTRAKASSTEPTFHTCMIPARLHDSFVWCVLSQSAQAMWQHHFLALPAPAATSTSCHILGTVGGFCIRHDSIMQTRPELQPGHCAHSDCSLPTSCSIASNRAFHGQRTCALCSNAEEEADNWPPRHQAELPLMALSEDCPPPSCPAVLAASPVQPPAF